MRLNAIDSSLAVDLSRVGGGCLGGSRDAHTVRRGERGGKGEETRIRFQLVRWEQR